MCVLFFVLREITGHSVRALVPEEGQWMSYVRVLPPGAALHTTRRSTFATLSPNSHTAHRQIGRNLTLIYPTLWLGPGQVPQRKDIFPHGSDLLGFEPRIQGCPEGRSLDSRGFRRGGLYIPGVSGGGGGGEVFTFQGCPEGRSLHSRGVRRGGLYIPGVSGGEVFTFQGCPEGRSLHSRGVRREVFTFQGCPEGGLYIPRVSGGRSLHSRGVRREVFTFQGCPEGRSLHSGGVRRGGP